MTQTYAERREARQNRIDARADKLTAELTDLRRRDKAISDAIPFGQPILVGHHSEGRARADVAKLRRLADRQCETMDELRHVEATAPTTAILAGDSDALDMLRKQIAKAEDFNSKAKAINAAARKGDREALAGLGCNPATIEGLLKVGYNGNPEGVPAYAITNNGANLRRLKERLAALEKTKAALSTEREENGVRIVEDTEAVRLRLIFDGKPAPHIIAELKTCGFRWAPTDGAWQQNLSNRARWLATQVLKLLAA